ncbi:MAG: hypothetical protein E6G41_01850, partial [Actinobacteria bacterium]
MRRPRFAQYPRRDGAKVPCQAQATNLAKGDLVIAPFAYSDGTCPNCENGITTSCMNGGFFPMNGDGGVPRVGFSAIRSLSGSEARRLGPRCACEQVVGELVGCGGLPASAVDQVAAQRVGIQQGVARFDVAGQVACEHEQVGGGPDKVAFGGEQLARAELVDDLDHASVGAGAIGRHRSSSRYQSVGKATTRGKPRSIARSGSRMFRLARGAGAPGAAMRDQRTSATSRRCAESAPTSV